MYMFVYRSCAMRSRSALKIINCARRVRTIDDKTEATKKQTFSIDTPDIYAELNWQITSAEEEKSAQNSTFVSFLFVWRTHRY